MSRPRSPVVVWCGRFGSNDGYGAAARSQVKAMRAAGVPHVAIDTDAIEPFGAFDEASLAVDKVGPLLKVRAVDSSQELVVVTHERPDQYKRIGVRGRARRVGYSYFEAATLPRGWVTNMMSMDEVWTSSEHNRRVFSDAGVPAWMLRVLPHPVDVDLSLAATSRSDRWGENTIFLTIVSGVHRRDLRVLYEAFSEAFAATDPVLLVIKVRPGAVGVVREALTSVMQENPQRRSGSWPRVDVIDAELTREQLQRLQAAADVYVSVERGDGWCLPAFESLALERPVISFDWGGSTEFIDPEDCYVVPVSPHLVYGRDSVTVPNRLYDEHLWPGVDPMLLADAFRQAAADPVERRRRGAHAANRLLETSDMRQVGRRLEAMMSTYGPHHYGSNAPAVVEVVEKGNRWKKSEAPKTGQLLDHRLIERANDPAFLNPSSPKEWAKAYRAVTSFEKKHRRRLPKDSLLVGPVRAAMSTSARDPVKKVRAVMEVRSAAKRAAAAIGGVQFAREVEETMADYHRCVGGRESRFEPLECSERRQKVWARFGGVKTPASDLARLSGLQGRHRGERIFILGNGPSLNEMDMSLLRHEYTFGVNKIYLKFPELEWRPTFYTVLDWRMGPAVAEGLAAEPSMTRFYPERFRGILPVTDETYWYWPRPVGESILDQFTPDATKGIPSRATILMTAIQLAFHLGFRELILVGVDASYSIPASVLQSGPDRFRTGTKLHLESTADDDPNHFDPSYFGTGDKWHDPNVDDMKRMFTLMRKGVERHGGRLMNATVGGNLDSLERVDYSSLFDR